MSENPRRMAMPVAIIFVVVVCGMGLALFFQPSLRILPYYLGIGTSLALSLGLAFLAAMLLPENYTLDKHPSSTQTINLSE